MPEGPLLSVIIPAFNCQETLDRALESALAIRPQPQVVVVDDGSSQSYEDSESRFPQVSFIRHGENLGLSQARKTGTLASDGEFILHLDADDYLFADVISAALTQLQNTELECLLFNVIQENENGDRWTDPVNQLFGSGVLTGKSLLTRELMLPSSWIWHLCVNKIVRRETAMAVYQSVNMWPSINMYEDFFWSLHLYSLLANRKTIKLYPECGYVYVRHESSITKSQGAERQQEKEHDMVTVFAGVAGCLDQVHLLDEWRPLLAWRKRKALCFCRGQSFQPDNESKLAVQTVINDWAIEQIAKKIEKENVQGGYIFGSGALADSIMQRLRVQTRGAWTYCNRQSVSQIEDGETLVIASVGSAYVIERELNEVMPTVNIMTVW